MKVAVNWRWFANDMFEMLREENPTACPYSLFSLEKQGPCQQDKGCTSEQCWYRVFARLQQRYAEKVPDEVCSSEYFKRLHPEYGITAE